MLMELSERNNSCEAIISPILLHTRGPGDNLYAWSQILTSQYALWQHALSRVLETLEPSCWELRAILIERILVHSSPSDQIKDRWSSRYPQHDVNMVFNWWGLVWARERCRISPPCFLAECRMRWLNEASFVLLYLCCLLFLGCFLFL